MACSITISKAASTGFFKNLTVCLNLQRAAPNAGKSYAWMDYRHIKSKKPALAG
ncbi:hypothetical protein AEST_18600 [Alishewanella aestuarii B11]|uniref:Uncharacterized protein n=1 Tax=Alishewanella aestuarii B11 TaxID=1197174 RepID=J1QIB9_9ALTE|nr:hypothetical protein AEST_18600 [Alishewanella aestuarii B11]